MNQTDLTKLIAICIAHIDSKIGMLREEVASLGKVAPVTTIVEKTVENPFSLPDGIIFESHLEDTTRQFNTTLERSVASLTEEISSVATELSLSNELISKSLSEAVMDIHGKLSSTDGRIDVIAEQYLKEERFSEYTENTDASLIALRDIVESYNRESSTRDTGIVEEIEYVRKSIAETVTQLTETSTEIRTESQKAFSAMEAFVTSIDVWHKDRSSELQEAFDRKTDSIEEAMGVNSGIVSSLQTLVQSLRAHTSKLESLFMSHTHPEYAAQEHSHLDLVSLAAFSGLEESVRSLVSSDTEVRNLITAAQSEMERKADKADVWMKLDTDDLVQTLVAKIQPRLQMPKDGKDAHEWEFKFHPNIRGILMYRRSDWSDWKRYNLIPQMPQTMGGMGGGGYGIGGGDTALTIKREGVTVEDWVREIDFYNVLVNKVGDGRVVIEGIGSGGSEVELPYVRTLTGKQVSIPQTQHAKRRYAHIRVFTNSNEEVSVPCVQASNRDVQILSNVELAGHYVVITNP